MKRKPSVEFAKPAWPAGKPRRVYYDPHDPLKFFEAALRSTNAPADLKRFAAIVLQRAGVALQPEVQPPAPAEACTRHEITPQQEAGKRRLRLRNRY